MSLSPPTPLKIGSDPPMKSLMSDIRNLAMKAIPDHRKRLDYYRALRGFVAELQDQGADEELEQWLLQERALLEAEALRVEKQRTRDNIVQIAKIAVPAAAASAGLIDIFKP